MVLFLCFFVFLGAGLNHMLGILSRHAAVRWAFRGSASRMHTERGLIHVVIVDHLASEHGGPRFTFAKDGGRVTPEVATVGREAPGEGVPGSRGLRSLAESIPSGGKESINTQQRGPLLEAAVTPARRVGSCQGWVGTLSSSRESGRIHVGRPRGHG